MTRRSHQLPRGLRSATAYLCLLFFGLQLASFVAHFPEPLSSHDLEITGCWSGHHGIYRGGYHSDSLSSEAGTFGDFVLSSPAGHSPDLRPESEDRTAAAHDPERCPVCHVFFRLRDGLQIVEFFGIADLEVAHSHGTVSPSSAQQDWALAEQAPRAPPTSLS